MSNSMADGPAKTEARHFVLRRLFWAVVGIINHTPRGFDAQVRRKINLAR